MANSGAGCCITFFMSLKPDPSPPAKVIKAKIQGTRKENEVSQVENKTPSSRLHGVTKGIHFSIKRLKRYITCMGLLLLSTLNLGAFQHLISLLYTKMKGEQ
ncbi:hypothetical protein D3C81_1832000 [compost metagenome]